MQSLFSGHTVRDNKVLKDMQPARLIMDMNYDLWWKISN